MAAVGPEGVVGLPQLTVPGAQISYRQIGDGVVLHAPVRVIRQLCTDPVFDAQCHGYQERFTRDVMQLIACNRRHPISARCARWLLVTHDRLCRARFELTQPQLAQALGVDVQTLRPEMESLGRRHIVKHDHLTVTIHDRIALRRLSCSCYKPLTPPSVTVPDERRYRQQGEHVDKVVNIRPVVTCGVCGLGRDFPHASHSECIRAIDAELLDAISAVRRRTYTRARIVSESLEKYAYLLKRRPRMGGRQFA